MPADIPAATTARQGAVVVPPKVASALTRFKFIAIAEGVALLVLVALMIMNYGFGNKQLPWWPQFHGFVFFVYFLFTLDLGFKARWKPVGTLLVILAGVVPVLSFWAERKVNQKVLAGERL